MRLLFDRTCKCMLFLFSLLCDRLHVHLICHQFHRTDYMCGWMVLCSSEQIAHLSGLSSTLMDRLDICFVLFHRTDCMFVWPVLCVTGQVAHLSCSLLSSPHFIFVLHLISLVSWDRLHVCLVFHFIG